MFGIVLLILVIGIVVYVISLYNSLQTLRTQITAAIQEIGNQLKRQASLIPNLESSTKGALKHEQGIFDKLTAARKSINQASSSNSAGDIDRAITSVQTLLPEMRVVVESNPELQANSTIKQFMSELTDTADKLTYARRTVIDLTQQYNQKLVTFPSNLIANMFGFKPEKGIDTPREGEHVSVSTEETKDVKVKLD